MKKLVLVALVVSLIAATAPAMAGTFLAMSEVELARQADAVVQGQIVHLESQWTESGRLIVTDALVAVSEVIAGEASRMVRVRTVGGEVDGVRVDAAGFPAFQKSERVVLFLARESELDRYSVLGYQLGHYQVVQRKDGVTLAVPQAEEIQLITARGAFADLPQSVELDALKDFVRAQERNRNAENVD